MKVKTLISFRDKEAETVRMVNEEFTVSKGRYQEIKEFVEIVREEKPVKKGKKNV